MQVTGLGGVVAVWAGPTHSLAVRNDGTVWGWGNNAQKQLGQSTGLQYSTPVQVPGLSNIIAVSGGAWHSGFGPGGRAHPAAHGDPNPGAYDPRPPRRTYTAADSEPHARADGNPTPTPTETPTPVPTSTPTAMPTPTPQQGSGQLCIRKFADLNGNGTRDSGGPWLSGWTFSLSPSPPAQVTPFRPPQPTPSPSRSRPAGRPPPPSSGR